jgi:hypothetical protein
MLLRRFGFRGARRETHQQEDPMDVSHKDMKVLKEHEGTERT